MLRLYSVKTRVIIVGDNLVDVILEAMNKQGLEPENNDILALTSKLIAYAENRLARLSEIKPSKKAKELAKKFSLQPAFAELILKEADKIYGGVEKAVLTLKNGILTANAGIDNKNAPIDYAILWSSNPQKWASYIREEIKNRTGKRVGVLIVDSGLVPLRKGTVGLALAVAGFKPIKDRRGEKDIYGKQIMITQHAVADDLASAAHFLMGEAAEKTPLVVIKDANVDFDDGVYGSADMAMLQKECIFIGTFLAERNG
ncbi:MAG: coenzyme F420-0:L-glutamate ligase [Candidatus Bathyarchaeota archaeon]|nr:coenzyme F420-0:L-glutamate ligase [Candidatus Bathyarchaeota archaeon]